MTKKIIPKDRDTHPEYIEEILSTENIDKIQSQESIDVPNKEIKKGKDQTSFKVKNALGDISVDRVPFPEIIDTSEISDDLMIQSDLNEGLLEEAHEAKKVINNLIEIPKLLDDLAYDDYRDIDKANPLAPTEEQKESWRKDSPNTRQEYDNKIQELSDEANVIKNSFDLLFIEVAQLHERVMSDFAGSVKYTIEDYLNSKDIINEYKLKSEKLIELKISYLALIEKSYIYSGIQRKRELDKLGVNSEEEIYALIKSNDKKIMDLVKEISRLKISNSEPYKDLLIKAISFGRKRSKKFSKRDQLQREIDKLKLQNNPLYSINLCKYPKFYKLDNNLSFHHEIYSKVLNPLFSQFNNDLKTPIIEFANPNLSDKNLIENTKNYIQVRDRIKFFRLMLNFFKDDDKKVSEINEILESFSKGINDESFSYDLIDSFCTNLQRIKNLADSNNGLLSLEESKKFQQFYLEEPPRFIDTVPRASFAQSKLANSFSELKEPAYLHSLYMLGVKDYHHTSGIAFSGIMTALDDDNYREKIKNSGNDFYLRLINLWEKKGSDSYDEEYITLLDEFILKNLDNPNPDLRLGALKTLSIYDNSKGFLRQKLEKAFEHKEDKLMRDTQIEKIIDFLNNSFSENKDMLPMLNDLLSILPNNELYTLIENKKHALIEILRTINLSLESDELNLEPIDQEFYQWLIKILIERAPEEIIRYIFALKLPITEDKKNAVIESVIDSNIIHFNTVIHSEGVELSDEHFSKMIDKLLEVNVYSAIEILKNNSNRFSHEQIQKMVEASIKANLLGKLFESLSTSKDKSFIIGLFIKDPKKLSSFLSNINAKFPLAFTGAVGSHDSGGTDKMTPYLESLKKEHGFDLNNDTAEYFMEYLNTFGLSKSSVLYQYFINIKNYESGSLSEFPEDQLRGGLTTVEALKKRSLDIRESLIKGSLPEFEDMTDVDFDFLKIETGFDTSRWSRNEDIRRLYGDFSSAKNNGQIKPLSEGYQTEEINVKQVESNVDLSFCRHDYQKLRDDILLASDLLEEGGFKKFLTEIEKSLQNELDQILISPNDHPKKLENLQNKKDILTEFLVKIKGAEHIDEVMKILVAIQLKLKNRKEHEFTSHFLRSIIFKKVLENYSGFAQIPDDIRHSEEPTLIGIQYMKDIIYNVVKQHITVSGKMRRGDEGKARIKHARKYYKEGFDPTQDEANRILKNMQITQIDQVLEVLEEETTDNSDSILMVPDRGIVGELSGYYADACWTSQRLFLRDWPQITPFKFIHGKDEDAEIMGSVLFIEAESKEGEKVIVVRGLNPRDAYLNNLQAKSFCEEVFDAAKKLGKRIGAKKILLAGASGTTTNRSKINSYAGSKYFGSDNIIHLSDSLNFNGYPIQNACYLVREIS